MSCDEKNNKRRKKRLPSKQGFDVNSHLHKSTERAKRPVNLTPKAGTPCIDGERCLLCHKERYERCKKVGDLSKSTAQLSNCSAPSLAQAPLWVCPDCRRNIEEEERRVAMEPSLHVPLNDQDLMLQQPSLNLTLSLSTNSCGQLNKCNCQSCSRSSLKEDMINDLVMEKEKLQLRCCWSEVRNVVRCIYREAGTSLADEEETVRSSLDENQLKMKVEKLMNSDAAQLFEKLETQAREYVREVKVRLIRYLTSCPMSPHHAKEFFAMLLDEYQALSKAFDILRPFFIKLDTDHLQEFGLSWDLLHKHLFYVEIYRDPAVYGSLPALITQLRLGAVSPENFHQDTFPNLLHRYLNFTEDLTEIEFSWKESERAFKDYKEKQIKLREKSGMILIEWEVDSTALNRKSKQGQNVSKATQQSCQCGNCSGSSSSLNPLPPFPGNSSISKISNHNMALPARTSSNQTWWTNPAPVSNFNPHLLVCNDLHSIPPSQLLPPPLMMNGLGNSSCHCPACSGTTGYREETKMEQASSGKMGDCQCSKCPYHGEKEQESRSRSTSHPSPSAIHTQPPNNNCIHNNYFHSHHPIPHGTPMHCPLQEPTRDLRDLILDNNLRHVKYNGFHSNMNGDLGIDDDENCASDSNSDDDDDDDDDDEEDYDDDDDDVSTSSPRRTSQSSDIDGLGLDAPPGSPSSVRSSGDGSSCDTPPVNQCTSSTSEDGRPERGKYCDCCYCEFFGHAAPPVAPTSHNYTEMRDKLRNRLNKRQPSQSTQDKKVNTPVVDHRSVDDLLSFINDEKGEDENNGPNAKARKRARKKQKKWDSQPAVCFQAAEKAEQNKQTNGTVPSECSKVNGVHQNGGVEIHKSELRHADENHKKKAPTNSDFKQKEGKPARRKAEELEKKPIEPAALREGPQRPSKSRKKQNHNHDLTRDSLVSKMEPKPECNGKENFPNTRRAAEKQKENERQDSVSPDPAVGRPDAQEKTMDSGVRTPQKKQGKKKKKASLDDVFLPREDIENDKLTQMDEAERELEEFKRFCMNLTPLERRERIPVNVNLKGLLGGKKNGSL